MWFFGERVRSEIPSSIQKHLENQKKIRKNENFYEKSVFGKIIIIWCNSKTNEPSNLYMKIDISPYAVGTY